MRGRSRQYRGTVIASTPWSMPTSDKQEPKHCNLSARSPWLLELRLDQFKQALEMRGARMLHVDRSDDGVTAKAEISYAFPRP